MKEKKVTVVVPVYNATAYIENTINSVINQTLDKEMYHILVVNDGSTDDSGEKLENIRNKYSDVIEIINQKNQGVGRARNVGLNKVKTPFVCFLDADDTYDNYFLEKMLEAIEKTNADVTIGGFRRVDNEGNVTRTYLPQKISSFTKYITMVSWNRIHRTSFLRKNEIHFFEDSFVEDTPFSLMEIEKGAKYSFIPYIGYNWTLNKDSFSSTGLKVSTEENSVQAVELLRTFVSVGDSLREEKDFQYWIIKSVFHQLLSQGRNGGKNAFLSHYNKAFTMLEKAFPEAIHHQKIWIAPKGESFKVAFVVCAMFLFGRLHMMPLIARIICKKKL